LGADELTGYYEYDGSDYEGDMKRRPEVSRFGRHNPFAAVFRKKSPTGLAERHSRRPEIC